MAKEQVTFGQLLALRDDILHQQNTSPAFFYFNKARVKKFFSLNTMALKVLQSRLDEMVKKYVMFDKEMQPITEEKDGQHIYKFYSEEGRQQFIEARNNFLNGKISIEL